MKLDWLSWRPSEEQLWMGIMFWIGVLFAQSSRLEFPWYLISVGVLIVGLCAMSFRSFQVANKS